MRIQIQQHNLSIVQIIKAKHLQEDIKQKQTLFAASCVQAVICEMNDS